MAAASRERLSLGGSESEFGKTLTYPCSEDRHYSFSVHLFDCLLEIKEGKYTAMLLLP
jgi:hypothetical protein